jgi:2-polyprenyl-3-methyl-5-hydroxy-6-metoxy-1,4-benzoquinol methylase
VCRLHHYEAFSGLARQVNWKAVSDLIFVSAHIRDLTAEQVPGLSDLCRLHVVPNGVDTERLGFRERERGFEVAYLGYVNFKKGPMLLVQAARAICRLDPRYRLHIGGSFQDAFHALYFKQMMEEFGLTKRVVLHGWIEDVDAWLGDKHYVLCTSLSEGHPVGILEAMAKGLKPLIHNFYGASRVFPRELLWSDLEELAERLAGPYEPERYRDYIAQNFDTRRQMARFEAIARGQAEADALGTPPPLPASRTAQAAAAPKPQHEPRHAAPEAPPHAAPRSQAAPPAQPKAESMNFYHALPREMKVTTNRKTFVADYCRGKRVLHVGCVDAGLIRQRMSQGSFLHAMLMETAARVWGVDCDAEGIDYLKSLGVPDLFCLNAEELGGLTLDERPDIIVASEVLEHMANPGSFLETAGRFGCELLVSVPNAFSYRCICELSGGREFVHQDHNCYFSYTTLKTLVSKAGYSLLEPVAYYWPLDDEIGRKHTPLMATNPYFADGFIFILSPQERPSLRPVPVVEQMGQAAG